MSSSVAMPLIVSAAALGLGLGLSRVAPALAAPAIWRANRARHVRWIGADGVAGEEAEAVREAVVSRGLSTYGEVTRHVADHLARSDYRRFGPNSDIGFLRSWYLLHACRVLERLDGGLVRIERG